MLNEKSPPTIISIMQEFDLSQEEFALLFDCYQHQVSSWVNGKVKPGRLRVRAILERYGQIKRVPHLVDLARQELASRKTFRVGSA